MQLDALTESATPYICRNATSSALVNIESKANYGCKTALFGPSYHLFAWYSAELSVEKRLGFL